MMIERNKTSKWAACTALLFVLLFLDSCKKDDPALFTITVVNLKFEVNSAMSAFHSYDRAINGVNFNALQLLAARGIDTVNIKSIRPRSARLYLPFADNRLDFIKQVAIRLCLPNDNRSFCGQEAFWFDEDTRRTKGFEHYLFGSNVDDLREFILTENINIQVQLEELWHGPEGTFEVFLDMEFDVR